MNEQIVPFSAGSLIPFYALTQKMSHSNTEEGFDGGDAS